jgi:molybdenum cofactor synthesis domain-containing protein
VSQAPTAGFVVIGDEILTGKVRDANTFKLAQMLFARGVRLRRVETITDDVDDIATTVKRLSETYTWVFTSGGIGPTHDDMTYEGIARAFSRELAYDDAVLAQMDEHGKSRGYGELNDARKRMALYPTGCEVVQPLEHLWVPVVVVENVHVLPGVPGLFSALIDGIEERFEGTPLHRVQLYTQKWEGDIAEPLTRAQRAHPGVAIGSYPRYGGAGFNVMVTLEGEDRAEVDALAAELEGELEASREPEATPEG